MNTLANPSTRTQAALKRPTRRPPPRSADAGDTSAPPPAGEAIRARDGTPLVLRQIHAGDVAALQRGFSHLTAGEIRMRFLHPLNELPDHLARRLCELDPQREIAFVLCDPPETAQPEIHAVARAHIDPVTLAAEFALVVQQRFGGQGFGVLLMQRLIAACRALGATEMWGDVFLDNGAMLELCDFLGFERRSQLNDPGLARVTLDLTRA